jgi:hypothetical protein
MKISGLREALGSIMSAAAGKALPFFRTDEDRPKKFKVAQGVKLQVEPFEWDTTKGKPRAAYTYRAARREALKKLRREDKKAAKRGRLRDQEARVD